jgi:glutamate/tyrosine decarboxylase-like PLP-dependent enzyme
MDKNLEVDARKIEEILSKTLDRATQFLQSLKERPVSVLPSKREFSSLPDEGIGADKALEEFERKYSAGITASSGSRYFGFVTGGSTPAALAGDWLVSVFDQNAIGTDNSSTSDLERETIGFLRQLFKLSDSHSGTFVSGATMSNFVGLALARQWVACQLGVNVAQDGLYALPTIKIFSGSPHSCILKVLSMLGMGKSNLQIVSCLPEREAVDLVELRKCLSSCQQPCIVVANAGTVNTVDFDDLVGIAELQQEFNFWFHVDAAFGGFAACSPKYSHLVEGLDVADSIAIDAHKWLNVPYDSAMQFTRHQELQLEVFQNSAAYLGIPTDNPDFVHLTPENSRRLRTLPAWFSLMAYGSQGYRDIVERNCDLAQLLGQKIKSSRDFKLLAPVRLNVVCFTLSGHENSLDIIKKFLVLLHDRGKVFLTPTVYKGIPAIRAAIANWRTEKIDIEIAWESLTETIDHLKN